MLQPGVCTVEGTLSCTTAAKAQDQRGGRREDGLHKVPFPDLGYRDRKTMLGRLGSASQPITWCLSQIPDQIHPFQMQDPRIYIMTLSLPTSLLILLLILLCTRSISRDPLPCL